MVEPLNYELAKSGEEPTDVAVKESDPMTVTPHIWCFAASARRNTKTLPHPNQMFSPRQFIGVGAFDVDGVNRAGHSGLR